MSDVVDEAVERLSKYAERDEEFEREFGKWRRPPHMQRYPLEEWMRLIRYKDLPGSVREDKIIEAEDFRQKFPAYERFIVGAITRFVFSEIASERRAGDKTLRQFKLQLQRRLELMGF